MNTHFLLLLLVSLSLPAMQPHNTDHIEQKDATGQISLVPPTKMARKERDRDELFKLVQDRINKNEDLNTPVPGNGLPPLFIAAKSDSYLPITELLLRHCVSADAIFEQISTPLYVAANSCATATMQLLLQNGANPNNEIYAKSHSKFTPLHALCHASQDTLVKKKTQKQLRGIQMLIKAGAALDWQNHLGQTSLFYLILKYKNKSTPCSEPVRKDFFLMRKNMICLLLRSGINTSIMDKYKHTASSAGGKNGCPELGIFIEMERAKLKKALKAYLCGGKKPEAQSAFKRLPSDLINIIVNFVYK
jgi:ankyrin repeat protein